MSINSKIIKTVFHPYVPLRRWVCYRPVWDESRQKYSKVPVDPHTGVNARSNDPQTWGTLDEACRYMTTNKSIGGVMIALSPEDDLVGIDIDDCRNPDDTWSLLAREIVHTANSYTEISPSDNGLRIMLYGKLPPGMRKNSKNGVEMYDSGRFLTITGNHLTGTPQEISRRDEAVVTIRRAFVDKKAGLIVEHRQIDKRSRSIIIDDDDLLDLAFASANGEKFESLYEGNWEDDYGSQSEADFAFCCMLAFWTGWCPEQMDRIFRDSELYRPKWDVRHYGDGRTYGQGLIEKAINVTDQCYLQEDETEVI